MESEAAQEEPVCYECTLFGRLKNGGVDKVITWDPVGHIIVYLMLGIVFVCSKEASASNMAVNGIRQAPLCMRDYFDPSRRERNRDQKGIKVGSVPLPIRPTRSPETVRAKGVGCACNAMPSASLDVDRARWAYGVTGFSCPSPFSDRSSHVGECMGDMVRAVFDRDSVSLGASGRRVFAWPRRCYNQSGHQSFGYCAGILGKEGVG